MKRNGKLRRLQAVSFNKLVMFLADKHWRDRGFVAEDMEGMRLWWIKYENCFLVNAKIFKNFKFNLQKIRENDNLCDCKTRITKLNCAPHNSKYPVMLQKNSYIAKVTILSITALTHGYFWDETSKINTCFVLLRIIITIPNQRFLQLTQLWVLKI